MESPDGAEHEGILSKKKLDHKRFEDPYKHKAYCWLKNCFFYIQDADHHRQRMANAPVQSFDLLVWKAVGDEKGKFSLEHNSGTLVKLKADSVADGDTWLNKIRAAAQLAVRPSHNAPHT
eukprot:514785-Rhodomonas_salina.1